MSTLPMQETSSPTILKNYEVMNSSISGLTSTELLNYYRKTWINFHPNIVAIDLSTNDEHQPDIFKTNLIEFVKLNKQRNIQTFFVLEANSPEVRSGDYLPYSIMKSVAENEKIPVIDLHQYLKSQEGTGILWWDYVHPTSYGHQLIGEFLFNNIEDILIQKR
jgi:lysophospholipase L1-like esterase